VDFWGGVFQAEESSNSGTKGLCSWNRENKWNSHRIGGQRNYRDPD